MTKESDSKTPAQEIANLRDELARMRQSNAELEQTVNARTEDLSRKNEELRAEIAERQRSDLELQEKQQLLERLISTHERDRQLVAYEIHDTFLQDVIAALMFIDTYYDRQSSGDEARLEPLEQARKLLRKSIDEARRMINGLRPPIIDEQGIVAGLEYLVNEVNARGLEIRLVHKMNLERLTPTLEAAIYRIVQEGLSNIERHSKSRFGQIKMCQIDDRVRLEIRDLGMGFDPAIVAEGHYGLQGIKERARLVGGTVAVQSVPNEGTDIIVEIPLPPEPGRIAQFEP